jgi:hypothetical protein
MIYKGQYPRIYDRDIAPTDFYPAYIQTSIEKDVRLMKNIGDSNAFIQFTQLCAGRVGQLLNYTGLANDAGISPNTAKSWISILESSYILYRLQPFLRNFNKRLVKSSKLYFYDTGIACSLLGIHDENQVNLHYLKGALFEILTSTSLSSTISIAVNIICRIFGRIAEVKKLTACWWMVKKIVPIEIKSGKTISNSYFDNLEYWHQLATAPKEQGYVVYGGDKSLQTSAGSFVSWRELNRIPR